jgi:hypothetical protein
MHKTLKRFSTLIKSAQESCTRNQSSPEPISTANTGRLHEYYLLEEEEGRWCRPLGSHTSVAPAMPTDKLLSPPQRRRVGLAAPGGRRYEQPSVVSRPGPRRHAAPHPTPSAIIVRVCWGGSESMVPHHGIDGGSNASSRFTACISETLWIRTDVQQLRT